MTFPYNMPGAGSKTKLGPNFNVIPRTTTLRWWFWWTTLKFGPTPHTGYKRSAQTTSLPL